MQGFFLKKVKYVLPYHNRYMPLDRKWLIIVSDKGAPYIFPVPLTGNQNGGGFAGELPPKFIVFNPISILFEIFSGKKDHKTQNRISPIIHSSFTFQRSRMKPSILIYA
jgi:hypothetical protein